MDTPPVGHAPVPPARSPAPPAAAPERFPATPPALSELGPRAAAALGAGRALVLDGLLGRSASLAVAEHLVRLEPTLTPAGVGREARLRRERTVRGDLTRWLDRTGEPPLDALWRAFDALATTLREQCWLGVVDAEVQLALYPGDGARYRAHRDAFRDGGRRRATAVYYLNGGWLPEHGGELRVHEPEGSRDVAPLLDRLVLFLSEELVHEVLPARAPRWAVTAWFLGPGPT